MGALVFIAIFWIAPIFVGHKLGAPKNRAGWAWGLLLGWIGVVIVACLSNKDPQIAAQDIALVAKQREVKEPFPLRSTAGGRIERMNRRRLLVQVGRRSTQSLF